MADTLSSALLPGVRRREVFGWAMYDFANSGYTTVVLTAVFNAYFVGVAAQDADWATFAWTAVLSVSSLLVMVTVPFLGAFADARRAKRLLLLLSTIGCVVSTAALALVGRGDLWLASVCIIASNLFFSYGEALIASFLPKLARPEALGRVSGWGWSLGYLGGMLTLGLSLAYVLWAQSQQIPATQFVPVTMLITAVIYAVAATCTFALLREPDRDPTATVAQPGFSQSIANVRRTWQKARQYQDFAWLMACGACYQAGISVVIALAAVYAEQVLGFKTSDTMLLIFLVNIAAALGAFAFGYFQDRVGHLRAVALTLVGWLVMVALAALAQGPTLFWIAAVIAGLCMGSSQSGGRALASLLTPSGHAAEFLGLWTLATRLAAIVGPLTYGIVTLITSGNHRVAIVCTGVFFLAGLWLLRHIDVPRGVAAARADG
jgi:MFS transporter, UMF1 family